MTKLTTKQFRAIVREEVAKFPGYIIDRSYTNNRKGPSSNLRSCAFYRIARKTSPFTARMNSATAKPFCLCLC